MISYLKGKVVASKSGMVIVETGGVGYGVNVGQSVTLKNGDTAEFFIYEHIREDCDDFYGFCSFSDLDLFEKLISVNGVGPKAGLNIMSSGNADRIIQAIVSDDLSFFMASLSSESTLILRSPFNFDFKSRMILAATFLPKTVMPKTSSILLVSSAISDQKFPLSLPKFPKISILWKRRFAGLFKIWRSSCLVHSTQFTVRSRTVRQ